MENYLGKDIKKLGFGLMRLPMQNDEIEMVEAGKMVDLFMEKGFTYFDTSPVYINGKDEIAARDLITRKYPRDSYTMATKLPCWLVNSKEDLDKYLNLSLTNMELDYIDFYLLHGLSVASNDGYEFSNIGRCEKYDAFSWGVEMKKQGKIKHLGFSFHDSAEVLEKLLKEHGDVLEFCQLQINYADLDDPSIQSKAIYEVAKKYNMPLVIMEPIKGGTLANLRSDINDIFKNANPDASIASWAVRYAASLDNMITVLSGMSTIEQVEDNVSYMQNFKKLDESELEVIEEVRKALKDVNSVGCTNCKYCVPDCPQSIEIPRVLKILNHNRIFGDDQNAKRMYTNQLKDKAKASECISCKACEATCPQKLQITSLLEEAASLFE